MSTVLDNSHIQLCTHSKFMLSAIIIPMAGLTLRVSVVLLFPSKATDTLSGNMNSESCLRPLKCSCAEIDKDERREVWPGWKENNAEGD